jgi:hypothetical protein
VSSSASANDTNWSSEAAESASVTWAGRESHRPSENQGGALPPSARLKEPCQESYVATYARAGERRRLCWPVTTCRESHAPCSNQGGTPPTSTQSLRARG